MVTVSVDKSLLDFGFIHRYLTEESYWAGNMPASLLETAIENSLCFGAYDEATGAQIGFARVVTDQATFAYLCDVFVAPESQGAGVGKALIAAVSEHLTPLGLRRWALVTRDAHTLYEKFGFEHAPEGQWMQRKFNAYGG